MTIDSLIPNHELTEYFVSKWDQDLDTIKTITDIANNLGEDFVLKGGFATAAYLGGSLDRAHGDIDATYYLKQSTVDYIAEEVEKLLSREKTLWEKYDTEKVDKIEFREQENTRDFFSRRRLELYIRTEVDPVYETGEYQVRQLIDSQGRRIEVKVMDLSELIALKARNLFMANNGIELARPAQVSDYEDLRKLLDLPEADQNKILMKLAKMLKKIEDSAQALEEAHKQYDFVIKLLATKP